MEISVDAGMTVNFVILREIVYEAIGNDMGMM
jgi:hypothetical protein